MFAAAKPDLKPHLANFGAKKIARRNRIKTRRHIYLKVWQQIFNQRALAGPELSAAPPPIKDPAALRLLISGQDSPTFSRPPI
jgi:hypothetical protein